MMIQNDGKNMLLNRFELFWVDLGPFEKFTTNYVTKFLHLINCGPPTVSQTPNFIEFFWAKKVIPSVCRSVAPPQMLKNVYADISGSRNFFFNQIFTKCSCLPKFIKDRADLVPFWCPFFVS